MSNLSLPVADPAESAANDEAEPTVQEPSLLADLAVLVNEIEAAPEGSVALDTRIHVGFRVATERAHDVAALLIETGITWPTVEAVMDEQIPPFTTSLDAALEGEDIIFIIRSSKRRRWGAMQKARCGQQILAWAATEPLARRLAAIKACCADLEKSAAATKPPAEMPTQTREPAEASAGESDWEVMF